VIGKVIGLLMAEKKRLIRPLYEGLSNAGGKRFGDGT
jgi:hypothetical protein